MSFSFLQRWKWSKRLYFGDFFYQDMEKRDKKTWFCKVNLDPKEWICQKNLIFLFFHKLHFSFFVSFFWRFWHKKNFVFFYKFFQNIVKFQIVRQFEKNDVLVENKNEISRQLQDGVSTLKMETLRFFLQSRKNFIIKKQLEISFFYANFLFIFLKKSRKNSEKTRKLD